LYPLFLGGLFLGLACRLCGCLGCNVYNDTAAVAPARRTCAMRHTGGAALAYGELLGLEGMVATAVSRMRPCVSHPDYHGSIYSIWGQKRQTPALCKTGGGSGRLGGKIGVELAAVSKRRISPRDSTGGGNYFFDFFFWTKRQAAYLVPIDHEIVRAFCPHTERFLFDKTFCYYHVAPRHSRQLHQATPGLLRTRTNWYITLLPACHRVK